ncbi:MAG: hypothetical protein RL698_2167 [Pseudomonadota bacterium]|jgi:hypothetical protein
MHPCDLCNSAIIARIALLGERSDRRVWLCAECGGRFEDHALAPEELRTLAGLASRRHGQCDWCAERPPAAQVRVPGVDGRVFAFELCESCARSAREDAGGRILHGQAAREGDVAVDPRYERALEVDRRRREFRLVK